MTTMEPFVPHPDDDETDGGTGGGTGGGTIAAADPGAGAPAPAPGFGVEGEEPDRAGSEQAAVSDRDLPDTPFRTPSPGTERD